MAGKSRRRNASTSDAAAAAAGAPSPGTQESDSASASVKASLPNSNDDHGVGDDELGEPNVLWIVFEQLDTISKIKSRCLEAMQAISDGKCTVLFESSETTAASSTASSSSKSKSAAAAAMEPHDGYWIVLATHILNRLLRYVAAVTEPHLESTTPSSSRGAGSSSSHSDSSRREASWLLAHIALRLTKILLWHDKTRLEKTASSSTAARALLGRALGSITLACVRSMERISSSNPTIAASAASLEEMDGGAMLAASIALDTVIHFQPPKPTSSEIWNRAQMSLLAATTTISATTSPESSPNKMLDLFRLQSACEKLSTALGMSKLEGPLVHLMITPAAAPTTTSSSSQSIDTPSSMDIDEESGTPKRNLRRAVAIKTEAESSSPLIKAWEPVLKSVAANTAPMEAPRVSVRRMPSIVLISLDQGQERILTRVVYRQLLLNFDKWSHVMECPAAAAEATPSVSTAGSEATKKKVSRGGNNNNNDTATEGQAAALKKKEKTPLSVPGNVAVVTLVCWLLQSFSEAVHLCGQRPPPSMDAYVAAILRSSSESSASAAVTTAKPMRGRRSKSATAAAAAATLADSSASNTDFRHLATSILYKLLESHMSCLRDNIPKSIVLVNDDDDVQLQDLSYATFYPLVHRSVDSLCRVLPHGAVMEQADMTKKKLLTLAACWIFQMQPGHVTSGCDADGVDDDDTYGARVVDAKLTSFAITQLEQCLTHHMEHAERACPTDPSTKPQDVSSSTTTTTAPPNPLSSQEEEEQIQSVTDKYQLLVPLPEPRMPKPPPLTKSPNSKRKIASLTEDSATNSIACNFAGVLLLESYQKLSEEGVLALFVRTTLSLDQKPITAALLTKLLDLVQICYDTPQLEPVVNSGSSDTTKTMVASSSLASKKRPAASSPSTRSRRKKRKVTKKGRSEEAFDENAATTGSSDFVRSRINSVRAGLATDVANCLRIILTVPTSSCSKIRSMLRKTFSLEHVEKLARLGEMQDDVILKTRMNREVAETESLEKSSSSKLLFFQSSSRDFTRFEKSLWSAHINLCVTIGRGKLPFVYREANASNEKVPFLRHAEHRLAMFRTIASSTNGDSGRKSQGWPLWMSIAHHALLASNMTSEPAPKSVRESSPERFVVHSFVTSIANMLEDLSKASLMDLSCLREGQTRLDFGIPLSLRNARLLALAFIRVDAIERQSCLNKLLSSLASSLSDLLDGDAKNESLKNAAASGFIARLITTCVTLANLILVGDSLHEPLLKLMGSTQYKIPTPSTMNKWYTAERCFMGLFSDWESPCLPLVPIHGSLKEINPETALKLNSILKQAVVLGFETAKVDRCHLLFAAWNSMAISSLWSQPAKVFPTLITVLPSDHRDSLLLLSHMRDDICCMNEFLNDDDVFASKGMASNMKRARGVPALDIKTKQLQEMIKRAEALASSLLSSITGNHENDKKQPEASPAFFSLLSGLAIYISFAISKHTINGNTLFNPQSLKRGRGYLTECPNASDPEDITGPGSSSDSDVESEVDNDVDLLAKLHDACHEFGAAPCHPDWIDNTCSLRTEISAAEALETSSAALKCLAKVAAASCSQYHLCWQNGMRILTKSGPDSEQNIALAVQLSTLPVNHVESTGVLVAKSLKDSISTVCGIDSVAMDMLFFEYNASHLDSIEAFCPNASQWIFGQRPHPSVMTDRWSESPGELRALGEWELLMSSALVESCLDFDFGISNLGSNLPNETLREAQLNFANAERWRSVFERVISHMMPASALFRMAVSGVGRISHPLSAEHASFDEVDQGALEFVEPIPTTRSQASAEQAATVLETLATLVSCSSNCRGDRLVLDSCQAVATNLLVDSKIWLDLEAIEAFRSFSTMLVGLRSAVPITNLRTPQQVPQAVVTLMTFLTSYLSSPHRISQRLPFASQPTHLSRTVAAIGPGGDFRFDTVGGKGYDLKDLSSMAIVRWDPEDPLPTKEKFGTIQKPTLIAMASALCCNGLLANGKSRAIFGVILSQLAWLERPHLACSDKNGFVVPALIDAFNGMHEDILKKVVCLDICSSGTCDIDTGKDGEVFRENLCFLFTIIISQIDGRFEAGETVLSVLFEQLDEIAKISSPSRESVLNLLFLYSTRYGSLAQVGSRLMSSVMDGNGSDESRGHLDCAVRFFGFVRDLRRRLYNHGDVSLNSDDKELTFAKEQEGVDKEEHGKSTKRPRVCSYVGMSGYHLQHWYNCYTCGLVGDTGCCTLCALTCHRCHEVSYSRHSSFFCDCGAGNAASSEKQPSEKQHPVQCMCLSSLSEGDVDEAFDGDLICFKSEEVGSESERGDRQQVALDALALDIAQDKFSSSAEYAVRDLLTVANESNWVQYLLKLMSRNSESCIPKGQDEPSQIPSCDGDEEKGNLQKSLLLRKGKPLELLPLSQIGLVPLRAVKTSTFQLKLSVDNVSDQPKRAVLTKGDNKRAALVADSRGRLIVAEQKSLIFCSAVPVVNVRYEENSCDVPFGRAQMTIIGSSALGFLVVGMELCRENERCLVAWGVTEACAVVLTSAGDSVDKKFELIVDPGHQDGDPENIAIVKCQWVPGSETTVVVACGPFVRVYDIGRDQANRVPPIIGFFLGYDTVLRDLAIVPFMEQQGNESTSSNKASTYKLLLLLGNGQIHSVDLKFDKDGALETPGEQCFESSEGLSLPVEGVRTHCGSSLGHPDALKKSFGEGSSLTYLAQSGLVLYRCASSCVLALLLERSGKIAGSFELLPNIVKPEILGTGPDGYGVSGPYVSWTELGTVGEGNDKAYCLACVGKSTRTNQPKLLLVLCNASFVKVKLLTWPSSGPLGLGLSLISSFEGLAAFSVPFVAGENFTSGGLRFRERACLVAATSNGSLLFFGEELEVPPTPEYAISLKFHSSSCRSVNRHRLTKSNSIHESKPRFPLTSFEALTSVDWDNLRFGGEGTGDQPLLRENNVFITSSAKDGCSLTVSLWKNDRRDDSQVIVALRVLVGSGNHDAIPQRVFIVGRQMELKANAKRWYDLPLTEEEVALSLRNGFVSLGIGPAFDSSNNPSLDAVEIFSVERTRIDSWLPKRLSDLHTLEDERPKTEGCCEEIFGRSILLPCSQALAFLCEFQGSRQSLGQTDRETLKRLLQATALDSSGAVRCSLMVLLEQIEPDARARATLVDEAVLAGCAEALAQLRTVLSNNSNIQGVVNMPLSFQQKTSSDVLLECLRVAKAIATDRPADYLQSIENLCTDESPKLSIAIQVGKVLEDGKLIVGEKLVAGFVELCLAEMAIAATLETKLPNVLANFEHIAKLLASSKFAEWCCAAMSSFYIVHCNPEARLEERPALFAELQAARPQIVAYKCDCCAACPILDTRYAVLEGDHDLDLCEECYRLGLEYAEKREYATDANVMIRGKVIGGSSMLNCAQIRQMQPVPIARADVESVETTHLLPDPSSSVVVNPDTTQQVAEEQVRMETSSGQSIFEDFCGEVFWKTLDLIHVCLTRDRPPFNLQLEPMVKFLLHLIRHSSSKKEKLDRTKHFAKKVSSGISRLLLSALNCDDIDHDAGRRILVICLRAFADLVVTETDLSRFGADSKENADSEVAFFGEKCSRVLCEVHGYPAVRRRCAHGEDKDRRFYTCGKEKGSRCDFFAWADEGTSNNKSKFRLDQNVQSFIWELLLAHTSADSSPLHVQLCSMLEQDMAIAGTGRTIAANSHDTSVSTAEHSSSNKGHNYPEDLLTDYHDGVFCSREKLQGVCALEKLERVIPVETPSRDSFSQRSLSRDPKDSMIDASLDLLAALACNNSGSQQDESTGVSRWFPLLCEIISSSEDSHLLRAKAKRVLKAFCGGSRARYHAIRDHFVFGFQFRSFLRNAEGVLETSLAVVEQARQCSMHWKASEKVEWNVLSAGGLLGCQDLVSEDALSVQCERDIAKILDEIWNVIKSRGGNWRRFCGLLTLPRSHRDGEHISDARTSHGFSTVFSVPPIISLFWAACSLRGSNQLKAMMLVDAALVNWAERKNLSCKVKGKSNANPATTELQSSDDEMNLDGCDGKGADGPTEADCSTPESILLEGPVKLSAAELHAFVIQFVCTGRTTQIRKVACHITCKLFQALEYDEQVVLFTGLSGEPLNDVGAYGKASVDFLLLLQTTVRMMIPSSLPLSDVAQRTAVHSLDQLRQLRFSGDWIIFDVGSGSTSSRKRIDLSLCVNCHRAPSTSASKESNSRLEDNENSATPRDTASRSSWSLLRGDSAAVSTASRTQQKTKWLPEQVQPFVRRRLDGSKDDSVSNEFATFVQLKLRLAISEIHVSVSDPRGRYVKTITVFFSPRPVADVDVLKSDDYSSKWQRCASLSLSRGANRASCSLPVPVVASNLKFEYTEFYERAGGSKASDGSLLVHCPRCTRVVQNAHGVCGNCGEVAFQCRKCRHINYDRLDAFLCVECGYCAAGNFSYEVTGGVASNAVTITNDEDYERALLILGAATKLSGEIRTALTENMEGACRQRKVKIRTDGDQLSGLTPDVKRAFRGEFPLVTNWKGDESETDRRFSRLSTAERLVPNGSVVASVACSETSGSRRASSNVVDRTRNLLRIARQIRSDSSGSRRSTSDVILRHFGRGLSIDSLDDEGDIIDLLEGASGGVFGSSDPLGRLVASIQSRSARERERNDADTRSGERQASLGGNGNAGASGSVKNNDASSSKDILIECEKLYQLSREGERECTELNRRIAAWQRLGSGNLVQIGAAAADGPSHCSACCGAVALHLLQLWHRLFLSSPDQVYVSKQLLTALLDESVSLPKSIVDLKRSIVRDVATKSSKGSKLVLDELRSRLAASSDVASSEILGQILESVDVVESCDFLGLAIKVLEE